mgnify:CR=1 FL=1
MITSLVRTVLVFGMAMTTTILSADDLSLQLVNDRVGHGVDQEEPSMVALPDGGFVATWTDERWGDPQVRVRFFDETATPTGPSIPISDALLNGGPAKLPCITVNGEGEMLVAWEARLSYTNSRIWYQRLSHDGSLLGDNERISLENTTQATPAIIGRPKSGFVVTWSETSGTDKIMMRILHRHGELPSGVIQVNDPNPLGFAFVSEPTIAMRKDGNFDVAWTDIDHTDEECPYCSHEIAVRRFDSKGNALDEATLISLDVEHAMNREPQIMVNADGSTRVVWRSGLSSNSNYVWLRNIDATGEIGSLHQLDDGTGSGSSIRKSFDMVSIDGDHSFVLFFNRINSVDTLLSQEIDSEGAPVGDNQVLIQEQDGMALSDIRTLDLPTGILTIFERSQWNPNLSSDIRAQWLDSNGLVAGSDFSLCDDVAAAKRSRPSVATRKDGTFGVTFNDDRDGHGHVYLQWYENGSPSTNSNVQITEVPIENVSWETPSLALSDTTGLVAWIDARESSFANEVYAQYLDASGALVGDNFRVRNTSAGYSFDTVTAMNDSGQHVIVWSDTRHNWGDDIYFQLYDESGNAISTNVRANSDPTWNERNQLYPSVDMASDGSFLIAWQDGRNTTDAYDIYAQWFSADGTRQGPEMNLTDLLGPWRYQRTPSVSVASDGSAMVFWESDESQIQGRRIMADGVPQGSIITIDQGDAFCIDPSVQFHDTGAVITWQQRNADIYKVRMGHVDMNGDLIADPEWINTDLAVQHDAYAPALALIDDNPVVTCVGSAGFGLEVWVATKPTCTLIADLDASGTVDVYDFSAMLVAWGTSDSNADLNNDGIVDTADFSQFLVEFGSACPSQNQPLTEGNSGKAKRKFHHRALENRIN